MIEKGFKVCSVSQEFLERELPAQGASSEDSLVT